MRSPTFGGILVRLERALETPRFDERYIAGLRDRDPEAEAHFVAHFRKPIWLKAQRQLRAPDMVEDACQETILRVFHYFRSGKGLENPERLPAFVHTVCHNVTLEMIRSKTRYSQMPETGFDPPSWSPGNGKGSSGRFWPAFLKRIAICSAWPCWKKWIRRSYAGAFM
jgi:DNA-directed RNA polymerase specialized sigma24 family protein